MPLLYAQALEPSAGLRRGPDACRETVGGPTLRNNQNLPTKLITCPSTDFYPCFRASKPGTYAKRGVTASWYMQFSLPTQLVNARVAIVASLCLERVRDETGRISWYTGEMPDGTRLDDNGHCVWTSPLFLKNGASDKIQRVCSILRSRTGNRNYG